MELCSMCPRKCNIDRSKTTSFCGQTDKTRVAKFMLHFGEEPCISAKNGSGAVFFSGCVLKCPFCQNHSISQSSQKIGKEYSVSELAELFKKIESMGAHNINLVTPTHFSKSIAKAIEIAKPKIPVVYNCSGYENVETLKMLEGLIQIYMPDFKYFYPETALRYSGAGDYPERACEAVIEMHRQTKDLLFDDDGVLLHGLIVRHLVLPSHSAESIDIMRFLSENLDVNTFLISLMSQYVPCFKASEYPEINRRVFTLEYERVTSAASSLGLCGYIQERESATLEMTPDFNAPCI